MPTKKQRRAHVSRVLRQCALIVDSQGRLKKLAERIDVHPVTVSVWIRNGRVPKDAADAIKGVFDFVDVAMLVGDDHE